MKILLSVVGDDDQILFTEEVPLAPGETVFPKPGASISPNKVLTVIRKHLRKHFNDQVYSSRDSSEPRSDR